MRDFDYMQSAIDCIDNEIVNMLIKLHEKNVWFNYMLKSGRYDFEDFAKQAKYQSVISTNRMEHYYYNNYLLDWLLEGIEPVSKQEKEVFAYYDALESIFKAQRPTDVAYFKCLNEFYEKYDDKDKDFVLRKTNRTIYKDDESGQTTLEFNPVDFDEIDDYIKAISHPSYHAMWNNDVDFLLVLPICILDFIKIYPLEYTSMQMSRLLMIAMLWGKCYRIVKYVSLERLIEESSDEFHKAIDESLKDWEYGVNDYKPFVRYILKLLLKAFNEFERKTSYIFGGYNKFERVERYIIDSKVDVTKKEIMNFCPDISETTVEIALRELKNSGKIEKIGGGRYTKYRYKST